MVASEGRVGLRPMHKVVVDAGLNGHVVLVVVQDSYNLRDRTPDNAICGGSRSIDTIFDGCRSSDAIFTVSIGLHEEWESVVLHDTILS